NQRDPGRVMGPALIVVDGVKAADAAVAEGNQGGYQRRTGLQGEDLAGSRIERRSRNHELHAHMVGEEVARTPGELLSLCAINVAHKIGLVAGVLPDFSAGARQAT